MKKNIFNYLSVLFILIAFTGCASNEVKIENDNSNQHQKSTLKEKYEYHSFICDEITGSETYAFDYENLYFNGSVYEVILNGDGIYSNNQHCKKIEGISYDTYVLRMSAQGKIMLINDKNIFYVSNNKIYNNNYTQINVIALDKDVVSIWNYDDNIYYVLKKDGNVYEYLLKGNINSGYKIVSSEKIIYSSNDYGKIKYFYYTSSYDKNIENIIIYSEKGLYTQVEIITDECTKYKDIQCEKGIVLNEEFQVHRDEILYFDVNMIIDKEMNIYKNEFVNIEYIP